MTRAINWLCTACGFERHFIARDETGAIEFAQLTLGNGMIMVAPVSNTDLDRLMAQPDEIGGLETRFCYFVVEDADVHCARAKTAGAEIVLPLRDFEHGGRGYSCRDPEGHIWSFGTHDPWEGRPPAATQRKASRASGNLRLGVVFAGLLATMAISASAIWINADSLMPPEPGPSPAVVQLEEQLAQERSARERAARAVETVGEQLARERREHEAAARELEERLARSEAERQDAQRLSRELREGLAAKEAAERAAQEAREQLTRAIAARDAAERAFGQLREELRQERSSRAQAEETSGAATADLAAERKAREGAQRVSQEAQAELARARAVRLEAERALEEARAQLASERQARLKAEESARDATEELARVRSIRSQPRAAPQRSRPPAKRAAKKKPASEQPQPLVEPLFGLEP